VATDLERWLATLSASGIVYSRDNEEILDDVYRDEGDQYIKLSCDGEKVDGYSLFFSVIQFDAAGRFKKLWLLE
jgi:hypothetical protein